MIENETENIFELKYCFRNIYICVVMRMTYRTVTVFVQYMVVKPVDKEVYICIAQYVPPQGYWIAGILRRLIL